jgi:nitrogen fixation NifU-like protein
MTESGYSRKAIELYANNVNVGTLQNPSIVTTFLGPCGDLIKLYLRINEKEIVDEAKFYYLGCPGSAASASAMTMLLKNKAISQAKKLTESDILAELGGLPESKRECATLCLRTLRKGIAEYERAQGRAEI